MPRYDCVLNEILITKFNVQFKEDYEYYWITLLMENKTKLDSSFTLWCDNNLSVP